MHPGSRHSATAASLHNAGSASHGCLLLLVGVVDTVPFLLTLGYALQAPAVLRPGGVHLWCGHCALVARFAFLALCGYVNALRPAHKPLLECKSSHKGSAAQEHTLSETTHALFVCRAAWVLVGHLLPAAGVHRQQPHNPDRGRAVHEGGCPCLAAAAAPSFTCLPLSVAQKLLCCAPLQRHFIAAPVCREACYRWTEPSQAAKQEASDPSTAQALYRLYHPDCGPAPGPCGITLQVQKSISAAVKCTIRFSNALFLVAEACVSAQGCEVVVCC